MSTKTYYHVADSSYVPGTDLLCRDELTARGIAPEWHWSEMPEDEYPDSWAICLYTEADLDNAVSGAAWMLSELPGSQLLKVTLPDDFGDMAEVNEWGMVIPAVAGRIPAEYIEVVR